MIRTLTRGMMAAPVLALFFGLALAHETITVDPIGHWHVFDGKTLTFQVMDDGEGVPGLDLEVDIVRAGSDSVTQRSVSGGDVNDLGDGSYALHHTVTALGGHALVARFEDEGAVVTSPPVAFDVAKAGEEGVVVTADGTSYVYQVRYVWSPGHIHANDEEPATLSFEVMRGIPEGDEIDWEQPWTNDFDHVTDARNPRVIVTSDDGDVSGELTPTYAGRGVYEVERIFSVEEVGDGSSYTARLVFTDPYHGAEVTHEDAYPLSVSPPH